jgi:hypothetical protein
MGEFALIVPEDEDKKEAFFAIVCSVRKHYPAGWEQWQIIDYTCEDLFGGEISPNTDSKMRFGLPTKDLVRAFYPNARDLPERCYRHIRKMVLNWPLGRALLYAPHSIVEKIHAPSYKEFMSVIRELRAQGLLTNRERTSRLLSDETNSPQPVGSTPLGSRSRKRVAEERTSSVSVSSKRSLHERGGSPSPKHNLVNQGSDDHLMAAVFQQQMDLFNKMLEMQSEQNKKITVLQQRQEPAFVNRDLNVSYESVPDSTEEEDGTDVSQRSPVVTNYQPMLIPDSGETEVYATTAADRAYQSNATTNASTGFSFKPHTVEAETKYSKADPLLAQQAKDCQRLGTESWQNIRYKDVQKQFQATPVFSALKVNNQLAGSTPNWTSVTVLERYDLTLGAITNGLLQQRKIFEELCENLPSELKQKVGEEFLATNSSFRKSSDALLQYVCGRRAEVIQQRRDTYKIKNKVLHEVIHSIPPSETHLFKEPELSQTVKDQGGIHKFFPFKKPYARTAKPNYKNDYRDRKSHSQFRKAPNKYSNKTFSGGFKKGPISSDKPEKRGQNKWKGPKGA